MNSDPEFALRFEAFLEEVKVEDGQTLDDETRYLCILAALIGSQSIEVYKIVLMDALEEGFAPVAVKEIVYQAVAYLGMGRAYPFTTATNEVFLESGISLPINGQETATSEDRLLKGAEVQVQIFGEGMRTFWQGGHINRWLASNCFGDYYTRSGLTLKQRELITFCFLAAQGDCEPQLVSHVFGNINLGNDDKLLARAISQCLPYIGYPRSLNALAGIKRAMEQLEAGSK